VGFEIPLAVVGAGGSDTFVILLPIEGSIDGNPWTTGNVSVSGQLVTDAQPTLLEATGFDARDANGLGELVLVTTALAQLDSIGTAAVLARLEIQFVPEPASALLLGSGILALAMQRRRSARCE